MSEKISIHWFRRDLRLTDNHALHAAIQLGQPVVCVFIFDANILEKLSNKSDSRLAYIHQSLESINQQLQMWGSTLQTYYGEPLQVWQSIIKQFDVEHVYCNRDYEPYAQERDKAVYDLLKTRGIAMTGYKDHVIFEKNEVTKDDGKPYTVFTPYSKKWKAKITESSYTPFNCDALQFHMKQLLATPILSLESMGMDTCHDLKYPSEEIDLDIIKNYHQTRDIPATRGTTRHSLHLRFGTMSIRKLAQTGWNENEKWLNELIWRDFYQMILFHFPHTVNQAFKPAYDRIPWRNNEEEFKAWCTGQTGYPIVDAGMRELNQTGFMHNRVRMIVASFLTKHLLIDWRWGERYFAEKLLDFELASNVGGWQWAASSGCDAAPYFRVFNPELQTQKFDAQRIYIKQWVPEHDTTAYVQPIVDHKFARERALKTYKEALQEK